MGRRAGLTPDQTRQLLLDSAAEVFARRGFEGATVAEIAERAGLSTGAVYGLFAGKAELFTAAVQASAEAELARVLRSDAVAGRASAMLRARAEALNAPVPRKGSLLVQAIVAAGSDDDLAADLTRILAARERHLRDLIESARQVGELDDGISARAATRFLAMVGLGATLLGELDLDPIPPDEWSTLIERLVAAAAGVATSAPTDRGAGA
jgi:AcrR family transcriptional regulator